LSLDDDGELENLKADIASRLRSACAHFPSAEFDDLVHQIARIEMKYERRSPTSTSPALDSRN
jgi:hypothetical protein